MPNGNCKKLIQYIQLKYTRTFESYAEDRVYCLRQAIRAKNI